MWYSIKRTWAIKIIQDIRSQKLFKAFIRLSFINLIKVVTASGVLIYYLLTGTLLRSASINLAITLDVLVILVCLLTSLEDTFKVYSKSKKVRKGYNKYIKRN